MVGTLTVGDLVGTLTSPSGAVFQRNGANGHNMCEVVFSDSAASINSLTGTSAPLTGIRRPVSPLGALAGARADGTWTLSVVDVANSDTGSLRAVLARQRICAAG